MSYEVVRLGELVDLKNGFAFKSTNYIEFSNTMLCRMSNIKVGGFFDIDYSAKFLPDDFSDKYSDYLLNDGDLVIAMTDLANDPKILGVPTLVKTNGRKILLNQRVGKIEIKTDKLHIPYLKLALSQKSLRKYFAKFAGGGLQINIGKKEILGAEIPLPPLDIQKKIADTLDKAQELIDKRKEQISALDKFLENLFLDMFGDPVSNPMGWEIKELGTLGYFKNGMNYNQSDKGFSMKFLGVGEFKYGNILKTTEILPMLELLSEPNEEYLLRNGDIVFVRSNGSKELVGRSILVKNIDEKTSYSGFCIRYRNESTLIIADFLINIFANENYKTYLKKDSRGANINNLNQQMLSNLNIIIPPLDLQNQFAFIVEKVEAEKTKLEASLKEMEDNFNSIMQRAFKGELF